MKSNYVKMICMVLCIVVLVAACTNISSAGPYDFVMKDPGTKKLLDVYNKQIKTVPLIMGYLNHIVASPQGLIKVLERDACEKDILDFTRKNPDVVIALLHVSIVQMLNNSNVSDNQLMYVTGVIEDPKAQAAKNGAEYQMEKEALRQMYPAYALYEAMSARDGLKDMVEAAFHGMRKSQKNKSK